MRADGCGERSVAPHRQPSADRSDENAYAPCALAMPSGRVGDVPSVPWRVPVPIGTVMVDRAHDALPDRRTATCWTASMIRPYPVQRHTLPANCSRISISVGDETRSSRSCTATTSPGVQNPHCTAPASTNACCTSEAYRPTRRRHGRCLRSSRSADRPPTPPSPGRSTPAHRRRARCTNRTPPVRTLPSRRAARDGRAARRAGSRRATNHGRPCRSR